MTIRVPTPLAGAEEKGEEPLAGAEEPHVGDEPPAEDDKETVLAMLGHSADTNADVGAALDWLLDEVNPGIGTTDRSGFDHPEHPAGSKWKPEDVLPILHGSSGGIEGLKGLLSEIFSVIESDEKESAMSWRCSVESGLDIMGGWTVWTPTAGSSVQDLTSPPVANFIAGQSS